MAPEYDFSAGERGRYAGRFYVDPETPEGTASPKDYGEATLRLTLRPGHLRLLGQHEVLHARRTRAS